MEHILTNTEKKSDDPQALEPARFPGVAKLLRVVGATVLLASAGAFLLDKVDVLTDVQRYFAFLAFTAALTIAGLVTGARWSDAKAGRTFLLVVAALIPTHAAQLGAIIYGALGLPLPPGIPAWAVLNSTSPLSAAITVGCGLLAISCFTTLSFRALIRGDAARYSALYIAVNLLLLLPTRSPNTVGLVASLAVFAVLAFEMMGRHSSALLRTMEGQLCRAMLFVPAAIMLVRTAYLYEPGSTFVGIALLNLGVLTFFAAKLGGFRWLRVCVEPIGAAVSLCGIGTIFSATQIAVHVGAEVSALMYLAANASLLMALSYFTVGGGRWYRGLAAAVLSLGTFSALVDYEGTLSSLCLIVAGITLVLNAYPQKERIPFVFGLASIACGVLYQMRFAIDLYYRSPWITLGVIGMATLFLSSLIERKQKVLMLRLGDFGNVLRSWK